MRRLALVNFALLVSVVGLASCGEHSSRLTAPEGALDAKASESMLAPSNVRVYLEGNLRIDIFWQDNSSNETGFEVHRSAAGDTGAFVLLATTEANYAGHTDMTAAPQTRYCYRVRAVRRTGTKSSYSAFSSAGCLTTGTVPPAPPSAPSNLLAVATSANRVELTWQDNSSEETGYSISRSSGADGTSLELARTAASATAYTDQLNVRPVTEYCYQVTAVKSVTTVNGTSTSVSAPAEACVTTPAPSAPPPSAYAVGAKLRDGSAVSVTVTWTDTSAAPQFRMYRSIAGAAWEQVGLSSLGNGTDRVFLDFGRQSEQRVCYRVIAYNAAGDAAPSSDACTTPPAAPTNVAFVAVDAQTLEIRWSDNSAVEDGYEIRGISTYCYGDEMSRWCEDVESVLGTVPANSTSYRWPELVSGTYTIYAMKDGGYSYAGTGTYEQAP